MQAWAEADRSVRRAVGPTKMMRTPIEGLGDVSSSSQPTEVRVTAATTMKNVAREVM
jgi:hypothetical protein